MDRFWGDKCPASEEWVVEQPDGVDHKKSARRSHGGAGDSVAGPAGAGIFSIVLGVSLTDFKRKRDVQRKLIGSGKALRFINKLRRRFGRRPLGPPQKRS